MANEIKRQTIHVLFYFLAFGFKFLSRWQVVGILLLMLFCTIFLIPKSKIRFHLYRRLEQKYSQGAIAYFLVLLVIVLVFPVTAAAVALAILALGDGMATLIGKSFKTKELPWNQNKSFGGLVAFLVFGLIGAVSVLCWMDPSLSISQALFIGIKTVVVAAIVESLPWKINDNISVPLVSAIVLNFLLAV